MKTTKKYAFCGRIFIANSGMRKYSSVHCADEAKKAKKKPAAIWVLEAKPETDMPLSETVTEQTAQPASPIFLLSKNLLSGF